MTPASAPEIEPVDRLPIVQYWHEEVIPDYIAELLSSVRAHNPDLDHRVFSESAAERLIEEHFGARHVDAFRACAVPAMQADYFRYCAILVLGGVYCDADERCVASLRPVIRHAGEGGRLFMLARHDVIVNGLFAFGRPGHPFLALALEIATANVEERRLQSVVLATGPLIFTCIYWAGRLGSFEALLELAEARADDPREMLDVLHAYCETIGDCERAVDAVRDVSVAPDPARLAFVREARSLSYKDTDIHYQHWVAREQSIFR